MTAHCFGEPEPVPGIGLRGGGKMFAAASDVRIRLCNALFVMREAATREHDASPGGNADFFGIAGYNRASDFSIFFRKFTRCRFGQDWNTKV
jgi:hypothetical protein